MFAAYKENAAKRKAARAAANAKFKARWAEIKEKEALDKLSREATRLVIKDSFKTAMAENNRVFKEKMAALKEQ